MSAARRLVLTADDYGYDPASSTLVRRLLREGAVTATTVLALPRDLAGQAEALRRETGPRCGLHLALTSERGHDPWRPLSTAAREALVQADGTLPTDLAAVEPRSDDAVVAAEIMAQHGRLRAFGLEPDRLDLHAGAVYGLHGTSTLGGAIRCCARLGMGLRLPRSLRLYLGSEIPDPFRRLHAMAVAECDRLSVPIPEEMATSRTPADRIPGYGALRDQYIDLLHRLPAGISEIFLHPGPDTPWHRARFGAGWIKRVHEARLVEDDLWRSALDREEIELVPAW